MFSYHSSLGRSSVDQSCVLSDTMILKSIVDTVRKYNVTNLRECFESYCYTKEKCAVCEEAYQDMEELEDSIIDMEYMNVTFCCKRCLFNRWIDLVHYLRDRDVFICIHPCCKIHVEGQYYMHSANEQVSVDSYIKNDLKGTGDFCCDPICRRVGFDQTDSVSMEDTGVNKSMLVEFTKPKMY